MSSKIWEISWFICLKIQVHSSEMIATKKRASQAEGSFQCLPVVDALGFIRMHMALERAERSKENGMGSKPPSILRDCIGILGSLLVPRCSLPRACLVIPPVSVWLWQRGRQLCSKWNGEYFRLCLSHQV